LAKWDRRPESGRTGLGYRDRDAILAKFTTLALLPAKHVDTGMGFERITAVLQGKESNYDTDVFSPIMDAIGQLTGKKYGGKLDDPTDIAFRVIADHLRMLVFAITDGALPSNKGRGSVIRSVLRRAVRFGYQCFGQREPFISKLVPTLVDNMGGAFPELKKNPVRVAAVIEEEEADFLRTIDRGLVEFETACVNAVINRIEADQGTVVTRGPRTVIRQSGPSMAKVSALSTDTITYLLQFVDRQGNNQNIIIAN